MYVHFGHADRTTFHPPPTPSPTAMTTDGCLGHRPVAGSNVGPRDGCCCCCRWPVPPTTSETTTTSSSALASRTSLALLDRLDPRLLDLLLRPTLADPGGGAVTPAEPLRPSPADDAVWTLAVLSVRPEKLAAVPPGPDLDEASAVERRRRPASDSGPCPPPSC